MRGGGCCACGDDGACCCGRCWLATLTLCKSAYSVSTRGTWIPASCASLIGEPRYVSISIGLRAVKSWYIVLFASDDTTICSMTWFRKPGLKLQPWALARPVSSSMTPVISERTPTFSNRSAWEGVSKTTLAGWKAIGLSMCQHVSSAYRMPNVTYPIIRSNCCCRMLVDTSQSTWPDFSVIASASAMSV